MRLRPDGMDVFYIDESKGMGMYVVTAVAMPFMRPVGLTGLRAPVIVWPRHFDAAKQWRRDLKNQVNIPTSKELHGSKLALGKGHYNAGKYPFTKSRARRVYEHILNSLSFLPDDCIMSAAAGFGRAHLYGNKKLQMVMHALFQRMRSQCMRTRRVNAMTFFDEGHPEYRAIYRRAQVYLPTGSSFSATTRNLPLDMFVKDANFKDSKFCRFTQIADLVAYATFMKVKHEQNKLTAWQAGLNYGALYDAIPRRVLNCRVSASRDGIVRM